MFDNFYNSQLKIVDIDLTQPGLYAISFHVFMYCQGIECIPGVDSVKIIINENEIIPIVYTVDLANIGQQKIWQKFTFQFNLPSSRIDVNKNIKLS